MFNAKEVAFIAKRSGLNYTTQDNFAFAFAKDLDATTAQQIATLLCAETDLEYLVCFIATGSDDLFAVLAVDNDAFRYDVGSNDAGFSAVALEINGESVGRSHVRTIGTSLATEAATEAIAGVINDAAAGVPSSGYFDDSVFDHMPEINEEIIEILAKGDDGTLARWSQGGVSMASYDASHAFIYVDDKYEELVRNVGFALKEYLDNANDERYKTVYLAGENGMVEVSLDWSVSTIGEFTITRLEQDFGTYDMDGYPDFEEIAYYACRTLLWTFPDELL